MATTPFVWGANGRQITNPEQAARQRAVAEALMMSGATPAKNWAEGLADVAGALSGSLLNNEVLQAEADGAAQAGELYSGLSSASPEADIIAAMSNPWANEGQQSVAQALLGQQFQENDPMRQLQLAQAQLNYDQDLAGPTGPEAPSSVREWEYFSALPPDQQSQYLIMKRSNPYLNTGTEFVQPNPIAPGETMGDGIAIKNEEKAYNEAFGSAAGKAAAERINNLPGLISKADNMMATIDGVLNDPALDDSTGWLAWMQLVPGTDAYRFGQRALQLQGQSFLQAFESLKGAGQITEIEGTKATQAIGRLSTSQSPQDYRDALNELKGIVAASKERAMQQAGGGSSPPADDVDAILRGLGI